MHKLQIVSSRGSCDQLTAGAASTSYGILRLGFLAVAVESTLFAARAFGLRSADAGLT